MCQIPPASFLNKLAVSSAAGVLPLVFIIPDGQKHPPLFLIVYPVSSKKRHSVFDTVWGLEMHWWMTQGADTLSEDGLTVDGQSVRFSAFKLMRLLAEKIVWGGLIRLGG
jgi:hypothetical protein